MNPSRPPLQLTSCRNVFRYREPLSYYVQHLYQTRWFIIYFHDYLELVEQTGKRENLFSIRIRNERGGEGKVFTDSGAFPIRTSFSRLFIKHFSVKLKKGSTFCLCVSLPLGFSELIFICVCYFFSRSIFGREDFPSFLSLNVSVTWKFAWDLARY